MRKGDGMDTLMHRSTHSDLSSHASVYNGNNATEVEQYLNMRYSTHLDSALSAFGSLYESDGKKEQATCSRSVQSSATATTIAVTPTYNTGSMASRLGMDLVGMLAIVCFGAIVCR